MTPFNTLPHPKNESGKSRRAGFEFELTGVNLQGCAELIAELFGGKPSYNHSLEAEITDTNAGTFKVELDAHMIKKLASELEEERATSKGDIINMNKLRAHISDWIGNATEKLVPFEIVTPPMSFKQFSKLEELRERLHSAQAKGTKAGFVNAFGMHINPEIPSDKVDDIRDILRAFLILYPWLKKVMNIDLTRRILTYIDPFPVAYVKLMLAKDYAPDWGGFITDYLQHNPTRNRALDLLPLFAHVRPDSLSPLKDADRKLIKARPAFHYRFPNCEIDNPDWRIARDWNYWVDIESLASDKKKLTEMASAYLTFMEKPLHRFSDDWVQETTRQFGYAAA